MGNKEWWVNLFFPDVWGAYLRWFVAENRRVYPVFSGIVFWVFRAFFVLMCGAIV